MVNLKLLRHIVGFMMNGLGFFWSLSDKFLCDNVCNGVCSQFQNNLCSLIFLFVGIIFIVCGYVVIVMKEDKREKLKKRLKRAYKDIKRW